MNTTLSSESFFCGSRTSDAEETIDLIREVVPDEVPMFGAG